MKPAQLVPGIKIEDNKVITDKGMASNIKGLYAAGDITGVPYQYVKAAGKEMWRHYRLLAILQLLAGQENKERYKIKKLCITSGLDKTDVIHSFLF